MLIPHNTIEKREPEIEATVADAPSAQFPLQSITLTFNTSDDDKDGDTVVSVSIDNHALLMGAANVGGGDRWGDGEQRTITIPVANGVDYFDAAQGHVNITIHPNGDDEWHYDVRLDMAFAGNGRRWVTWAGLNVAEDRPSVDLTWV